MNTPQAVSVVGEVYKECSKIFPWDIQDAFLYGSYARGDYDAESDIDVLLTVKADGEDIAQYRDSLAEISSDLSLKHDVTISITTKPLEQFLRYSGVVPFYRNVLQEGIRYAI